MATFNQRSQAPQQHESLCEADKKNGEWQNMLKMQDRKLRTLIENLEVFCGSDDGLAFMARGGSSAAFRVHARVGEVKHTLEEFRRLHGTIADRIKLCEQCANQVRCSSASFQTL